VTGTRAAPVARVVYCSLFGNPRG